MDEEEIEQKLEEIAEQRGDPVDDVREDYEAKVEQLSGVLASDMDEDELPDMALGSLRADVHSQHRVAGKTEELPILALGHGGERPMTQGQAVIAFGIINPTTGGQVNDPPDEDPPGFAVFICKESMGADLGDIREKFTPFNEDGEFEFKTLKGWFSRRVSTNFEVKDEETHAQKGRGPVYICETTTDTKVEEAEVEGLPSDRDEIRELINGNFITDEDKFTLATFHENLSAVKDGYTTDFGADVKRIRGHIVDVARKFRHEGDDNNEWGRITVVDDSVADISDLEATDLDTGMQGRPMGLQVWLPPDMVRFGPDSIVDVYGALRRDHKSEEVVMDGISLVPIAAFEATEEDFGNNGSNGSSGGQTSKKGNVTKEKL